MARARLTAAHNINGKTVKAGSIVCDGTSCQAGDVLWTGLNSTSWSNQMQSLDAGGNTLQAASRFPTAPSVGFISGVNSIEP
jgi:hypothetical protein